MSTPEDLTGSLKYISDFDETNPPNTGQATSYGDDHIRGIKNAVKNTFPNIDAPVTATEDELNALGGYTGNTADLNILSGANTAGVTSAEFQYLNGVTSAIQTQIDGKQATDATITALAGTLTAANKIPYATATDTAGELDLLDEDDMVSDSATGVPTQQSVRAYVDANSGGGFEYITTDEPASDVASIPFTGLSGYRDVKLIFAAQSSGNVGSFPGEFRISGRISGGTWREIIAVDAGAGNKNLLIGEVRIHNFGSLADKFAILYGARGDNSSGDVVIDRSNAVATLGGENGANQLSYAGYATYEEAWDEIKIEFSDTNLEGSASDNRAYAAVYGYGTA